MIFDRKTSFLDRPLGIGWRFKKHLSFLFPPNLIMSTSSASLKLKEGVPFVQSDALNFLWVAISLVVSRAAEAQKNALFNGCEERRRAAAVKAIFVRFDSRKLI